MQDTFWLSDGRLLRTHTSPVQIRALEKFGPPLKMIAPGRVLIFDLQGLDSPQHRNLAISDVLRGVTETQEQLYAAGMVPDPLDANGFRTFVENEINKWKKVAKAANVKAE